MNTYISCNSSGCCFFSFSFFFFFFWILKRNIKIVLWRPFVYWMEKKHSNERSKYRIVIFAGRSCMLAFKFDFQCDSFRLASMLLYSFFSFLSHSALWANIIWITALFCAHTFAICPLHSLCFSIRTLDQQFNCAIFEIASACINWLKLIEF